ncbi:hypothetical protein DSCO28_71980 [Desulfosarcina ovata subsp. sediminis]|uniref:DUF4124 domain-containing protein n=1 Tax=Desulfosarcina ovata subsp. sediminis TaxID=885957 RepID=A0A5K8A262_9BACT|nr:DUF4124 domain-containing protein [Desulfosarcina ovata]BBO86632.1 hypothetical protein DSCO28_71980 [Desulfosarcina ovata subsp. sediminis]
MKPYSMFMVVVFVFVTGNVSAELYKWVDENGVAHYSNVAPPADQDASVKVESKGGAMPAAGKSNNLGDVLKSYKKDEIKNKLDDIEKRSNRSGSKKSDTMADYYDSKIKRLEIRLQDAKEDLKKVERESYSDARYHNEKVESRKKRVRNLEFEINEAIQKYQEAKYGN